MTNTEHVTPTEPLLEVDQQNTKDHWLSLKTREWGTEDMWARPSVGSITVKWDGCCYVTRYFNGTTDDADTLHVCDLDNMIELLQEAKRRALEHFGKDWPA